LNASYLPEEEAGKWDTTELAKTKKRQKKNPVSNYIIFFCHKNLSTPQPQGYFPPITSSLIFDYKHPMTWSILLTWAQILHTCIYI